MTFYYFFTALQRIQYDIIAYLDIDFKTKKGVREVSGKGLSHLGLKIRWVEDGTVLYYVVRYGTVPRKNDDIRIL